MAMPVASYPPAPLDFESDGATSAENVAVNVLGLDTPGVDEDRYVLIHQVHWDTYIQVRELLERAGLRMTYLKGVLEIMSPSRKHEGDKTRIARLIELFALERDVALCGYGSTTFRKQVAERGLEPDECYVLNRDLEDDGYPDIALEVVLTNPGINKLEVYRGLGVREVWFWYRGSFQLYQLGDNGYERQTSSALVPQLNFVELARFAETSDQHAALKAYREHLREIKP